VQAVLPAVVEHRVHANIDHAGDGSALVDQLLCKVAVV
jgi:hypothetical protein